MVWWCSQYGVVGHRGMRKQRLNDPLQPQLPVQKHPPVDGKVRHIAEKAFHGVDHPAVEDDVVQKVSQRKTGAQVEGTLGSAGVALVWWS